MAKKSTKDKSVKKFGLKDIETRMIQVMQAQHQEAMGNFLTFICTERLAYKVTENTKFAVNGNELVITEQEPEKPKEEEKVETA